MILFLDLDGTIREPKSGAKFINDPYDQKLIDGVTEAIAHYHSTGWQIFRDSQREWNDEGDIFRGTYRKSGEGMLLRAMVSYSPDTHNNQHWMVGDREEDKLAAAAAGIIFIWADMWRHRFQKGMAELDLSSRDIGLDILRKFLAT